MSKRRMPALTSRDRNQIRNETVTEQPQSTLMTRRGRIRIRADEMIKHPERARETLEALEFLPFRVESMGLSAEFTMEGISPQFREVNPGHVMPDYIVFCQSDEDTGRLVKAWVEESKL